MWERDTGLKERWTEENIAAEMRARDRDTEGHRNVWVYEKQLYMREMDRVMWTRDRHGV